MMNALETIAARKSVRSYKTTDVSDYQIDEITKAAGLAPNAGPFHITLVQESMALKEINDKALKAMKESGNDFLRERAALPGYQPLYGAPLLFIFSAPASNPYSLANVSNAATCASIAATALLLGSCYVITPTLALGADPALAERIGIPHGFTAMCGLLVGYSGDEDFASPRHAEYTANTFA